MASRLQILGAGPVRPDLGNCKKRLRKVVTITLGFAGEVMNERGNLYKFDGSFLSTGAGFNGGYDF